MCNCVGLHKIDESALIRIFGELISIYGDHKTKTEWDFPIV